MGEDGACRLLALSAGGRAVTTQAKVFSPWEVPRRHSAVLGGESQGTSGGVRAGAGGLLEPSPTPAGLECLAGLDRPTHACWNRRPTSPRGPVPGAQAAPDTLAPLCAPGGPLPAVPFRLPGIFASSLLAHTGAWLSSLLTHSMGPGFIKLGVGMT